MGGGGRGSGVTVKGREVTVREECEVTVWEGDGEGVV